MGNLAPAYCECSEDCNQGLAGGNSWSKPDKKGPQATLPVVEQEKAITGSPPPPETVESQPTQTVRTADGEENRIDGEKPLFGADLEAAEPLRAPVVTGEPSPQPVRETEAPSQQEAEAAAVDALEADPPPADPPAADGIFRFEVSVTKESSEGYGLAHVPVEDGSNTLLIVALRDQGPVARWNEERRKLGDDEKTVQRGDRIVAVGGVADDVEVMRSMLRQDAAVFTLERWPDTIIVSLVKRLPADKFGMSTESVKREDGVEVLRVSQIWGGLMSEWNQSACQSRRFHEAVTPACEIVRLDELTDSLDSMQQALMTRETVELTFTRPDPSAFHK